MNLMRGVMAGLLRKILITGIFLGSFKAAAIYNRVPPVDKYRAENKAPDTRRVTLLCFGDINLGRTLGKIIIEGNIDYPFEKIASFLHKADIVLANLESQLSDQHGETEHPKYNMIFTGPPAGALSLSRGGITHVSTSNNHAFDYGMNGLKQTMQYLDSSNTGHVGTCLQELDLYEPLVFEKNTIRFALFSVTDVMNFQKGWQEYIAVTDTGRLFPKIREYKTQVDIVILSYHGGKEYAESPSSAALSFAKNAVREGVNIFVGHHPHVAYGMILENGKYIIPSLGNFVFVQSNSPWTKASIGGVFQFEKIKSIVSISRVVCVPLRIGYQPSIERDSVRREAIINRTIKYSNFPIQFDTKGILN
jgi:poly-gamma-glutamate capsule biosynthesis protein CapA/YwtB (metallophosphatase superfamily)